MKIAIITSGILPVPAVQGGAVENLIDYLLEYNNQEHLHDITVYSAYHKKVKKHPALLSKVNHYKYVKIHSFWFKICAKWYARKPHPDYYYYQIEYYLIQIIKRMKKTTYDVIILENRPGFAIRLAEAFSTPIITHIHTNLLHIPSLENLKVMDVTAGFIVVSEFIKKEILKICNKEDIHVVYNGLDFRHFNRKNTRPIKREVYGFKNTDFVAVYWGRLVPDKGIKELLQAFQLLKKYKDIKLLIIGSTNYEDTQNKINDFYKELQEIAQDLQSVVKFSGYIPYEEIAKYLFSADVAVIPSHINEAFGMTCIEACALGLPVIATNDGGIPETLVGQKHILMDLSEDLPSQIANSILKVKNNYSDFLGNSLNPLFQKDNFTKSFFDIINSII